MSIPLNHIGIYVNDMEVTIKFYRDAFGFHEPRIQESDDYKLAFFNIEGGLLEFIQRYDNPLKLPDCKWSHLAFNPQDYNSLVSKLEDMGVNLRKHGNEIFFKDPDGHDIEIMERGVSF